MDSFILCEKCKKTGFVRPSACCPGGHPKAGDHVEFLSDMQTEKGPSAGVITISCGNKILVKHSDTTEEFIINNLMVVKRTTHNNGNTLWMLS
ncbi:MAG: hypothetical protein EOL92_00555 [Bacteroidia bacterium]|nr:hypothetical protein [Bacteroidia bacterium]